MQSTANIGTVALYARVSTKDGRQDTENQLIALREYCSKHGWVIAGEMWITKRAAIRAGRTSSRCSMMPGRRSLTSCFSGRWTGSVERV
jgi:hypothetical protein